MPGGGRGEGLRSPPSLLLPGRRDSSGIRLYYTATLRRFDAGIMELGLVYTPVMAIPPRETAFVLTGYCTDKCTQLVSGPDMGWAWRCPASPAEALRVGAEVGGLWLCSPHPAAPPAPCPPPPLDAKEPSHRPACVCTSFSSNNWLPLSPHLSQCLKYVLIL